MTDLFFANPAPIPYNSAGSSINVVNGYWNIFSHVAQTDCVLDSCRLTTGGACGTALAQTDLVLGAAPFSITATEKNFLGYSHSICYSCDIKPTGLPMITFDKDLVIISALALDCSSSLTDVLFVSPASIPYNSAGSSINVVNGYWNIFSHSAPTDCVLDSCRLTTGGACGTALAQTDLVLGAAPFSITATEKNFLGYSHSICYSCDIKPTGLPMITFDKDLVIISALALDCSSSSVSFTNPAPITYNSAGSSISVINSYTLIFIHNPLDCFIDSCSIRTGGACGTPLVAQTDIVLGATPFSITATELNPLGYSYSICYSCIITPEPASLP